MDKRILQYPLVISYPRSGTHWLNIIMELYFDRPRLRRGASLLSGRTDYMWFHDHDIKLKVLHRLKKDGYSFAHVLYLKRKPMNVIYSNMQHARTTNGNTIATLRGGKKFRITQFKERYVRDLALSLSCHVREWTSWERTTTVQFEKLLKDVSEFEKVCDWTGQSFDEERIRRIIKKYDKKNITEPSIKRTFGITPDMETAEYREARVAFKERFGEMIGEICEFV